LDSPDLRGNPSSPPDSTADESDTPVIDRKWVCVASVQRVFHGDSRRYGVYFNTSVYQTTPAAGAAISAVKSLSVQNSAAIL